MPNPPDLIMQISLNIIEHLGEHLYGNVPAVLSEMVANAWDADAKIVKINFTQDAANNEYIITILDGGIGMTRQDVIDRFLTVGYKRRDEKDGANTKDGRKPMGRKGIGKLSCFSIAEIIEVVTVKDNEKTAFRMDKQKIKAQVRSDAKNKPYKPEDLGDDVDFPLEHGTQIILRNLKKGITANTFRGLKQRIARRFSVIGENDFEVQINDGAVAVSDRGYQNALQFLWTYGDVGKKFSEGCSNLVPAGHHNETIDDRSSEIKENSLSISGWIGSVKEPDQLKDSENDDESLNRIAVFVRGKLAQEDLLAKFGKARFFADYLIGELHFDDLDDDEQEDIATSDRQGLNQNDTRFVRLKNFLNTELSYIEKRWNELRGEDGVKQAREIPAINEWLDEIEGGDKEHAKKWLGRINTLKTKDARVKIELYKASILAFELYAHKKNLGKLEKIPDASLEEILGTIGKIDKLEHAYYGQITGARLEVIDTLEAKIQNNEFEAEIQKYLFNHLWLLDPSWERISGTAVAEKSVAKFVDTFKKSIPDEGRVDIGYRTVANKHVIIELKRPKITISRLELVKQIQKYHSKLKEHLNQTSDEEYKKVPPAIEIICVLGKKPSASKDESEVEATDRLQNELLKENARIVYYKKIVKDAHRVYAEYFEKHAKLDALGKIFVQIENFTESDGD